ncbi:MAG: alpha-amylase family glycosyl hydrolase, partial [Steroidobacteraceae bacterium]
MLQTSERTEVQEHAAATATVADADWWRGAVIYQVYPRSFADTNGDGIGDLPGVIAKLDYIASLGVDAIWLSPFFRSPMKDFGYDVSAYRQVDPIFGRLEDFDALVAAAHGRELRIIIDQVLNHTSDQHAWFQASRQSRNNDKSDWYVWADPKPDGTPPNNWLSVFGGSAWQWEPCRAQYYLHNFLVSQPDLNYHHPAVAAQMLEEAEFWLARGVDGFRLDAINFCFHDPLLRNNPSKPEAERRGRGFRTDNPYAHQVHLYDNTQPQNHAFLEALRRLIDRYPPAVALGEVSAEDPIETIVQYTAGSKRLHMAYNFELLVDEFSAAHVRSVVGTLAARCQDCWPCWAIGNHDVARVASRWSNGSDPAVTAKVFNALLLSLRGSVCSYQGEELGLTQAVLPDAMLQDPYGLAFWPTFKGRDGCRTPIPWNDGEAACGFSDGKPWLPIPPEHRALAVSRQDTAPDSVLNAFRSFVKWRRGQPALLRGSIRLLDAPADSLCLLREHPEQALLACFNFAAAPCAMRLPTAGRLEPLSGHGFAPCEL